MNAEEMDQKVSKYSDCWNVCVSAPFTHNPRVHLLCGIVAVEMTFPAITR